MDLQRVHSHSPSSRCFYALIDVSAVCGRTEGLPDDVAFAEALLEKEYVAAVPGSALVLRVPCALVWLHRKKHSKLGLLA